MDSYNGAFQRYAASLPQTKEELRAHMLAATAKARALTVRRYNHVCLDLSSRTPYDAQAYIMFSSLWIAAEQMEIGLFQLGM